MQAGRSLRVAHFALLAIAFVTLSAEAGATTMLQDKGIFLAGPFGVPDITQPPNACAEAVFLAGSSAHAPLYLNELVVAGSGGQFSNNGWAAGSFFDVNVVSGGTAVWISWDLAATSFAVSYISVNFDNTFYHVYEMKPGSASHGSVEVTGNQRDVITHIRFFGTGRVPDAGGTGIMFVLALAGMVCFSRRLQRVAAN